LLTLTIIANTDKSVNHDATISAGGALAVGEPVRGRRARIASPIRGFTRSLSRDHEIDGTPLPQGSRVVLLVGAANLDETRFPNPESYDIHRPNGAHVGWGNGPHACAGANLAKLEVQALLRAMVPHVRRMATSNPTRLRNNTLQGFSGLTARFN